MKPATIISGASVFLVTDVVKSAAYYRDALGFRYDRFWGDPPDFCMLWRDNQCFMLAQVKDAGLIRPVSEAVTAVWDAYLWVEGVDEIYAEVKGRGARIKYEPVEKPYGVKEFAVLDPDGHQIAFGEELDGEQIDRGA